MKNIVKNAAANHVAFNAIMENARQIGLKTYACIPLTMLVYDEMYQRGDMINSNTLNKLIANFDSDKMDAIRVVAHKETATFAIVDGIHRAFAVQKIYGNDRGIEAEIIRIPDYVTAKGRQLYEAKLFVQQNDHVETLSAIQKHSAGLLLGNKADLLVADLCKKYHLNAKETDARRVKAGTISGFAVALKIARIDPDSLINTFEIINRSGWIYETSAFKGSTLRAFRNLLKFHPDNLNGIMKHLPGMLRYYSPQSYEAKAISQYPVRSSVVAMSLLLEDDLLSKVNAEATYKLEAIKRHPEIA